MNDNKGQTIFLSVIGIATLLVAIVGATFAWFSATVDDSATRASNSVIVRAAELGTVTFRNGDTVTAPDIYPGWSATKIVSIEADSDSTGEVPYVITLHVEANDFLTAGATQGYITYDFTAVASDGQGTPTAAGTMDSTDTSGNITTQAGGTFDIITGTLPASTANGNKAVTHTYTITFAFPELSIDQNSQQSKDFHAYLTASANNHYTWDGTQADHRSVVSY